MILTIITLIITIVGIVIMLNVRNDTILLLGILLFAAGLVAVFINACFIFGAHVGVDAQIEKNRIEYESLCKRQEIVNSDYEDMSKSEVIKDIAEWNKHVYSYKYWAYNPWTNWFY